MGVWRGPVVRGRRRRIGHRQSVAPGYLAGMVGPTLWRRPRIVRGWGRPRRWGTVRRLRGRVHVPLTLAVAFAFPTIPISLAIFTISLAIPLIPVAIAVPTPRGCALVRTRRPREGLALLFLRDRVDVLRRIRLAAADLSAGACLGRSWRRTAHYERAQ